MYRIPFRRFAVLSLAGLPVLQAETWNVAGPAGTYSWTTAGNWTPGTVPNAIGASALLSNNILFNGPTGPQLQGTVSISLNSAVTLGNLTMGDSNTTAAGFNGNGFFTVQNGTGGSLTFDASSGNATLQKTSGSGTTDTITATTILTDTLAADIRTGSIAVSGLISGGGGIIRSGSVSGAISSAGGTLTLSNNSNSYTGSTTIEHGTLNAVLNGDILASTNSVFGNSATAIAVGLSTTAASSANGTSVLTFTAGSDAANYNVTRDIDFSQGPAAAAGATLNFNANGAGSANTNTLTLGGTLTFGTRAAVFSVARSGMTINIDGAVVSPLTGAGAIRWGSFPPDPGATVVDGRGPGTFHFSNLARTYTNAQSLGMGRIVINGTVGALGSSSSIGTQSISLNVGTGGNIVGGGNFAGSVAASRDTSADTIRSVFLEDAGNSYARILAPGGGSLTTPGTGGYTGNVSVINGYQIGGLNTSGTVVFSGAIASGDVSVAGAPAGNAITNGVNLALICQTGGTVEFSGGISDTPSAGTNVRVTVNQFRNHANLDGQNNSTLLTGSDGVADAAANQLVGTATAGTVIVSGTNTWAGTTEVLGGKLLMNGTLSGTGTVTVASGATLGGTGSLAGAVNVTGVLAPGASVQSLATGNLSLLGGSTFQYELQDASATGADLLQVTGDLGLTGTVTLDLVKLGTGSWAATDKLTLIGYTGSLVANSLFTFADGNDGLLADGELFTFDGTQWVFNYDDTAKGNNFGAETSGLFVTMTAVPEPSAAIFLAAASGLLLRRRRPSTAFIG